MFYLHIPNCLIRLVVIKCSIKLIVNVCFKLLLLLDSSNLPIILFHPDPMYVRSISTQTAYSIHMGSNLPCTAETFFQSCEGGGGGG